MLLIEHWYPGKYSVTCTWTVLPAMVAPRNDVAAAGRLCTTLPAQLAMVARFLYLPRGGTILRYGIHIASSAVSSRRLLSRGAPGFQCAARQSNNSRLLHTAKVRRYGTVSYT